MNNPPIQPTQQEDRRRKNALIISLSSGAVFTVIAAILGVIGYSENGNPNLTGIALTGIVALAAYISAFQSHRNSAVPGIAILITTILLLDFALPIMVRGQTLAMGIATGLFAAGMASATLPPKWVSRVIAAAFSVVVIITIIELYLPNYETPAKPGYANAIAIAASLIYVFLTLRRFKAYSLRTKIIIAFILITTIPLIVLIIINSISSRNTLETQSKAQLTTLSKIAADRIDRLITTRLDSAHTDAKQLSLISYLELPPQSRAGSQEETNARLTLLSLTNKEPVFIHSIALLDADGIDTLDTFDEYKDRNEGYYAYFLRPLKTGLPYASNIVFRNNKANIYFTAPIKTRSGEIIGVLRMEYYATVIQSIIRSVDPGNPDTLISLVDSNTYMRAGYTGNRNSLFKSYKNFTDIELAALQSDGRLPAGPRENAMQEIDDVTVASMDNLQQQPFFNTYSESLNSEAINTGVFLQTQPWIALVLQSTNAYLTPVREQNKTNTLISLLLVSFSVAIGFMASQILASPLSALTKTAEKITTGDFNARAQVKTEDEIGALATAFNRMTDQLNQTLSGLEQRVAERTTDLEMSRRQSIKRANELQSISEISKIITSEQKFENLLPLITRLVSERFGFYHTGIFLFDNTNQFAVLQAANSTGGQNMLKRGHKLEVGESGIVGYVAKSGIPRISLDVGKDAVYFNNPDLPNTRSEMALPLKVREQIVGVLDVQSERPGAFTENDTNTLSILADQIAIALENARLFTQTEQALSEAQALYRQNLQEGWKTFSREKEIIGYHQSLTSGEKLTQLIETDEIRQVINRRESLIFHADGVTQEASIVVPIKLRGQIIGTMKINAPDKNRSWSSDEVNLTEVISERLSIALENSRLIEESQRQAAKEQTINEITGKIGASINLKNVLQTAVEELGRALPGSEVIIKFEQKNANAEPQS